MKTEFLIYRPGVILPEIFAADMPEECSYQEIKSVLAPVLKSSGHISRIPVEFRNEILDMFVNDRKVVSDLPVNKAATLIFDEALRRSGAIKIRRQPIQGSAAIALRHVLKIF